MNDILVLVDRFFADPVVEPDEMARVYEMIIVAHEFGDRRR